ncbi:hypothetical protein JRO89_XS04G0182700 [Xanthoceras sorbifolium]|uniref:Uncharacterized protein n=1 Tax=Xanthoceras sorbifolium TaxID=99658 RepID=A0ABQ8I5T5_9ROSI|nr:hypothetical protein JRO89_XS04G0182700 [Xanthoceras sorbifolium]
MAKKKATQKANSIGQENNPPQDQNQKKQNHTQEKTLTLSRQSTLEDASEMVQNLKDLNSMLLKETLERRQQIETLVHSKADLEAELTGESDKNVCLEIEEGLFRFLVRTQMGEMGVGFYREKCESEYQIRVLKSEVSGLMENLESERERLSQACRERDLIKSDLDCQVKEANGFKARLFEMETKERVFEDEVSMLKNENELLVKEKNERDRDVESVREEKGLVERRLVETLKEINYLKGEIEGIVKQKKEIEMETSEQKVKINELDKEVVKLNEIVLNLQKEEKFLREKVLELEKSYGEAVDNGEEMASVIDVLRGEKNEKQRSIEKLMEQKEEVSRTLETAMVEVNEKEGQIKKLLREKNEIEVRKVSQESEIVLLHKEINDLRVAVFELKRSCLDQEEKSKQLVNEVTSYKNALDRVKLERDDIRKGLDEEKKNGLGLKLKISEMEKKIKKKVEELSKIRIERDNLVEEMKKMEDHMELLMKEKESVQKNLSEAQQGVDDMRAKMESFGINSDRALSMLKSTAALVCQSEDEVHGMPDVVVNEKKLDDVADPYAAQLEVIKNAFGNKEKLVEDMKKKVEFMQNSVAEAEKKKSFWTIVSSATTLFAAASVAYVARIR